MSFKFKPSDFDNSFSEGMSKTSWASTVANAKLAEWLSTGVKVYTNNAKNSLSSGLWVSLMADFHTHEALLVCIKPIERECTEHEPVTLTEEYVIASTITPGKIGWSFFEHDNWKCQKCGKRLKATWQVCDE